MFRDMPDNINQTPLDELWCNSKVIYRFPTINRCCYSAERRQDFSNLNWIDQQCDSSGINLSAEL